MGEIIKFPGSIRKDEELPDSATVLFKAGDIIKYLGSLEGDFSNESLFTA